MSWLPKERTISSVDPKTARDEHRLANDSTEERNPMGHPEYTRDDFGRAPLMFYYEITQACDLVCKHCRASAQSEPAAGELDTTQSKALIDQVASFPRRPTLVMTGGDPLKRADLLELIGHAVSAGLPVALTPSATPLATRDAFQKAKQAGVQALGISLDGADAQTHDAFRGWEGSFERTMGMLSDARELGFPVQVNTSITRRNFQQIDALADLLSTNPVFVDKSQSKF
jgi:MoaA/NifB/PqqE/SkfB family radical SAM enzyme